jgi:hypothetical protein
MTRFPLPGSHLLAWMRNDTLRFGTLTGLYLGAVLFVSLLLANRVPFLEPYADARNAVCIGAFTLVVILPLWRFRHQPVRMFTSAILAWAIFSVLYAAAGLPFERLHLRFPGPFHAFFLGASLYGFAAVARWVMEMLHAARQAPVGASRRRPY